MLALHSPSTEPWQCISWIQPVLMLFYPSASLDLGCVSVDSK